MKIEFTASFPLLERGLKMNRLDLPDNIKTYIVEHLEIVSAEFQLYILSRMTYGMFCGTETR